MQENISGGQGAANDAQVISESDTANVYDVIGDAEGVAAGAEAEKAKEANVKQLTDERDRAAAKVEKQQAHLEAAQAELEAAEARLAEAGN